MNTQICLVVAFGATNLVIGDHRNIQWRLKDDLSRFKKMTWGHPMIMDVETFKSIGRILTGRKSIVINFERHCRPPSGVLSVPSFEVAVDAAKMCTGGEVIFVIGGAEVFKQALLVADRIEVTAVYGDFPGDNFFPRFFTEWEPVEVERLHHSDERNSHPFKHVRYERR